MPESSVWLRGYKASGGDRWLCVSPHAEHSRDSQQYITTGTRQQLGRQSETLCKIFPPAHEAGTWAQAQPASRRALQRGLWLHFGGSRN